MPNYRPFLLFISMALSAQVSAAEDNDASIPKGPWSFVFALPADNTSSLGLWRRIATRTRLGLEVPFRLERRKDTISASSNFSKIDRQGIRSEQTKDDGEVQITELTTGLQTGLKQYLGQDTPALPFVLASAFVHFTGSKKDDPITTARIQEGEDDRERLTSRLREDLRGWSTETGTELGVGIDWFPAESVSVGGYAGIRFSRTHGERNESFDESVKTDILSSSHSTSSTTESDGYILGFFSSRLKVHLYF